MIKHILFDCDGVLIDTEIVAAEVVSGWLNTQGMSITVDDFILNYTGKTFTDIIGILKAEKHLPESLDTVTIVPTLDRGIKDNMRPINGVHQMLASIKTPVSAVSNSAKDYVLEALEMLHVSEQFGGRVFSAEMVPKGKPNPAVYELALETLGLNKDEVIVVEDSVAGVTASVGAGLKTIGYLGGSHIREGHAETLEALGTSGLATNYDELLEYLQ
ncbi:HAD superfamily hydrolase (TIGR01509 family) [Roseivirga pacifica]|uniref:Haloacid dehalogenase superfamily, subfamily IA, variant 3 with third motif having DD or ED n=1 Tax=Roseivirga pacifica TaxID=1267423 RepID=A0A1I0MZI9_9BACT|nr:HAD family phosphatase [Roseivirga pacifica]RKQ50803.1 HAD superfamily hydrolase (TIGR01509 family) [Roseivirga pacifica]SEV93909.1 haloacid dehalogenase superfamily, subfamily IA, variant 3 with third motif having DD or ED [Roseivirga pacifica]